MNLIPSLLDLLASTLLLYGSRSLKPDCVAPWIILAVVTLVFYLIHITALIMVKNFTRVIIYVMLILCKSRLLFGSNQLQNQLECSRREGLKS